MKSSPHTFGFYLFQKGKPQNSVLKELLQFIRSHSPGKNVQFSYVEGETSLIPHLSLWENLHVVIGGPSWKEFVAQLDQDWKPLVNLIKDPDVISEEATSWERLMISLLKGILMNSQHLLVDMNEDIHTPINLMNFKKMLVLAAQKRNVYIATANMSLWLDSAHSLVNREGYQFMIQELGVEQLKRHKIA